MAFHIKLKRSKTVLPDGQPKLPTADSLAEGEIAVNYASGVETLALKNADGNVVSMLINGTMQSIAESLAMHEARNDNPHGVTKAQVGLGNVDNTADADKPVSTAQQAALDKKLSNAANGGIANNLTTNSSTVALSAAQGIILNGKISEMTGGAIAELNELESRVTGVEEEIQTAIDYIDDILQPRANELRDSYTI